MPNYRRFRRAGGTYFFTVVANRRAPILCLEESRLVLRRAIDKTRIRYPFVVVAWVLLPDHLHCIWELPPQSADFSTRWRLIKTQFTRRLSKRHPRPLWQPRFWEHCIRDQGDLNRHIDYIHFNPVKHGLVQEAEEWKYSTYHRFVEEGFYHAKRTLPDVVDIPHAE